jgi:ankyrin repeat protein
MTGPFPGLTPQAAQLFEAAGRGDVSAVTKLLEQGADPNVRESGDNTTAMHWAAAAGHLEVVRRLADAGGDVVGAGDDHEMEVIGWASCWDGCNDDAHRAIVDLLLSRGAKHHIFSAIAMNLGDEVRRLVAANPGALNQRQSRNELHRLPLHFAVHMNRPEMVALLIELGADPLGVDAAGQNAAFIARTPDADRAAMQKIRGLFEGELLSAQRGNRPPNAMPMDLAAVLTLREWDLAHRLVQTTPPLLEPRAGLLHLMTQRNDLEAVRWLLKHGAPVNGRWNSHGAEATALHLAARDGHLEIARLLLERGADPSIRDSQHDSDPLGWAEFFKQSAVTDLLRSRT